MVLLVVAAVVAAAPPELDFEDPVRSSQLHPAVNNAAVVTTVTKRNFRTVDKAVSSSVLMQTGNLARQLAEIKHKSPPKPEIFCNSDNDLQYPEFILHFYAVSAFHAVGTLCR